MTLDRVDGWRIVDEREPRAEPLHHGLDAAMLDRVGAGEAPPTLRFWDRAERSVLLGRFQAYADEVATDYVEREGITVVRRLTGGGAVYCEPGGVLTYSIAAPRDALPDDVAEGFAVCNEWVAEILRELGVDAYHDPLNDIAGADGKIAGSAQLRTDDAVLHHAVLSHTLDAAEMVRVLRIGEAKLSDKAVRSAESAVAPVGEYTDATPGEVTDALREGFRERFGGTDGSPTDAELADARARRDERFGDEAWTRRL
ncbi:MAG: biotin/lipoate A/B protein ligase family protein [Haloferacaceae archaeon]